MKTKFLFIQIILILFSQLVFSQTEDKKESRCDCDECHQFDFWIGKWKAEWKDKDGNLNEGSNTINSILDGCVIEENFNGNPAMDFKGKSFSVYNHKNNLWQQTWVDNSGGYMVFTGGKIEDKMILSRTVETNKGTLQQRMVYYNIKEDSFDWNWESSTNNGESWKLNWKIKYTRR